MELRDLGYDCFFEDNRDDNGFTPARISSENRGAYTVIYEHGEIPAEAAGKLLFSSMSKEELPAVGDWVEISAIDNGTRGIIHSVLPRKTSLIRKAAGRKIETQVIAANIDIVFIVQGLDGNFNLRRLERYLVTAKSGGARPIVLLSKSDLHSVEEIADFVKHAAEIAVGTEIRPYSSLDETGVESIGEIVKKGQTACFIGSSGVGKSTLINRLAGNEALSTFEVREKDAKGRHITTRKSMIFLEDGGILIDTPGMRELGIVDASDGIGGTFPEIVELSESCRFRDCTHTGEPGCAVTLAIENGEIERSRYGSYLKLISESEYIRAKMNEGIRSAKKKREKHYKKWLKEVYKFKGK